MNLYRIRTRDGLGDEEKQDPVKSEQQHRVKSSSQNSVSAPIAAYATTHSSPGAPSNSRRFSRRKLRPSHSTNIPKSIASCSIVYSRWEIQFKGAGLTPYSRTADGRKVRGWRVECVSSRVDRGSLLFSELM